MAISLDISYPSRDRLRHAVFRTLYSIYELLRQLFRVIRSDLSACEFSVPARSLRPNRAHSRRKLLQFIPDYSALTGTKKPLKIIVLR